MDPTNEFYRQAARYASSPRQTAAEAQVSRLMSLTISQAMSPTLALSPELPRVSLSAFTGSMMWSIIYSYLCYPGKQCYHCQGVGHVQADCPTLRLSGATTSGVCYSCGQPGHLAVRILSLS
jgi:hypothetical protein